jgi:hypothetical protein
MANLTNDILGEKYLSDTESAGGYNYYGFVGRKGNWAILRENTAGTEYRYKVGSSGYPAGWTARASHTYVRLDQFNS